MDIGVVIGRFQVADLSDGHRYLIDHALHAHRNVLVLVGSSQEWGSEKNPLNYQSRERMLRTAYPDIMVVPQPDFPGNNKRWSHHVDMSIANVGWRVREATLYAGRDSFKPYYEGKWPVVEVDSGIQHVSGTEVRANIGKVVCSGTDFRRGVIYATQNPPQETSLKVWSAKDKERQ